MKKIVLFTLILVIFGSLVAFAETPVIKKTPVNIPDTSSNRAAVQLKTGKDIGQYLMIDKPFSEIHLRCPSWNNNIGGMTFKLFEWQGDYETTVKSKPIAEEKFVDFDDNAWVIHYCNSGSYDAGEYLWIITEPKETVGIWKYTYKSFDTAIQQKSYTAGKEAPGCYMSAVVYKEGSGTYVAPKANVKDVYVFESPRVWNPSPKQLTSGKTYGQYLNIDAPFTEIRLYCPSWGNNIGTMTLTFYQWQGDYNTTVNSNPIGKEKFVDYKDNGWLKHRASQGAYPAGEYLWVLSDPVETVGIWLMENDNLDSNIIQASYENGSKFSNCFMSSVVYYEPQSSEEEQSEEELAKQIALTDIENITMCVGNKKAFVKGYAKDIDVAPTVIKGRTFLPVRFVAESLGCIVKWNEETQTVSIENDQVGITLVVGESAINVAGEYKKIDAAPYVTKDRTMVPVRAIAEALGMKVNYLNSGIIKIGPYADTITDEKINDFVEFYK